MTNPSQKTWGEKWLLVTERFIRTGTRGSSSWPGDPSPTTAGYIYADYPSSQSSPLLSGGGPYISPTTPVAGDFRLAIDAGFSFSRFVTAFKIREKLLCVFAAGLSARHHGLGSIGTGFGQYFCSN
jgi:hypothetical protein